MGLMKCAIAVGIFAVCKLLRFIYERTEKFWYFTTEEDNNFNLCLCILLAAWIIRDGLW